MSKFVIVLMLIGAVGLSGAQDLEFERETEALMTANLCRNYPFEGTQCLECCESISPGDRIPMPHKRSATCRCVQLSMAPHYARELHLSKKETKEQKEACSPLKYRSDACGNCCANRWLFAGRSMFGDGCKCSKRKRS